MDSVGMIMIKFVFSILGAEAGVLCDVMVFRVGR